MESKELSILEETDAATIQRKPKEVDIEIEPSKDARKVLLNKKKLKNLDPETVNLPPATKICINESLCTYYKKLWSKCKNLWDAKHILLFWVSNGSIRVKLKNESFSSIMTHDCDLANLFPDNPLIDDY